MTKWAVLGVLSAAQFLMVLDQAVMNVSISQLEEDFDTDVTTIQGVITLYSLVMASLMILGGKLTVAFVHRQRRLEAAGREPLVHLRLLRIPPLQVSPRALVRAGVVLLVVASLLLLGTIEPETDTTPFAIAMLLSCAALLATSALPGRARGAPPPERDGAVGAVVSTPERAIL